MTFIQAQKNSIDLKVDLDTLNHTLNVQQKTTYYNTSSKSLNALFFHNWANSFKDNTTPLAKRFTHSYRKDFHFAEKEDTGHTKIFNIIANNTSTTFKEASEQPDVLEVQLPKPLLPKDSLVILATYKIKIPNAKYTGYGKTRKGYHLRYWYLSPVVMQNNQWQTMSNLNIDDLFENTASFSIDLNVPSSYNVESNLYQHKTKKGKLTNYYLVGKEKKDIIININKNKRFKSFQTKNTEIKTDIFDHKIDYESTQKIIKREVSFIEEFIGKHPHVELFIDANTVNKNSLKELYGLPDWLKPYPENFKWEIRFFKALTTKYIDDVLLLNKRTDHWLNDGIQTFLMIEYLKKYYPDVSILGKYSKIWGLRKYNVTKLKQTDKYPFVYQLRARSFLDQPLTMPLDSLTKLNRNVVSKYKAGLGLKYLQDFIGDETLKDALKEFYIQNKLKITNSEVFASILKSKTTKNLDWFFGDYIKTNKKIDYKIDKITPTTNKDSIDVTIKNVRNISVPVALYGVDKKDIKFKKWITNIDTVKTIRIKNDNFDRLALNYEQTYPEYNSLNNFKKTNTSILNKPIQFRFYKDLENPYYHQVFYKPNLKYNLYDGISLGLNFDNKHVIKHNFEFRVTPNYAFGSQSLTGSFSLAYNKFLENSKTFRSFRYGISAGLSHYDEDLSYRSFSPFANVQFRKKGLRDLTSRFLSGRLIHVDLEVPPGRIKSEEDNYTVLKLRYTYSNPNIIKGFTYALNTEIADNFSKVYADIRYRKFFNLNRRFNLRFYGGAFLSNKSTSDYFSFGLNRGSDYLFELNLLGRSETEGIYSQQFVTNEGGFKSFFNENSFANQYLASTNTSFSVWRWLEVYNNAAVLKNRNQSSRFFYENGIRFNFISSFFEIYLPVYTNEGLQINQESYSSKIRFVMTTSFGKIYNFFRRDFL